MLRGLETRTLCENVSHLLYKDMDSVIWLFVIIGNVVAHAFFPDDDRGGSVHFDAEETWTVTATKGHCYFVVFFTIKCYSFK